MKRKESSMNPNPTTSRTSQACNSCRSLKSRCRPSVEAGKCQRCFNAGRKCEWAETPQRPIIRRGPSRISQVERKVDTIVSRLVDGHSLQGETSAVSGSGTQTKPKFSINATVRPNNSNSMNTTPEDIVRIHDFEGQQVSEVNELTTHGSVSSPTLTNNDLVNDLLESGEAEQLVEYYRSTTHTFPFVPIPSNAKPQELHKSKPILLLAILTVSSWKNRELQILLEERYKQELAHQTFIAPSRSISLLQSILIYLSRYHLFFNHKFQGLMPLLHTAIALTIDLNLHKESTKSPLTGKRMPQISHEEQRSRNRSMLGCYYLASAISVGLHRPNVFKFSDYMVTCCDRLRQDQEFQTDRTLLAFIEIRRLDEQICEVLPPDQDSAQCDPEIPRQIQLLRSQISNWCELLNNHPNEQFLVLSYHHALINLNDSRASPMSHEAVDDFSQGITQQISRMSNRLKAAKAFLDAFIAIPTSDYHLLSFVEWMRLPRVIMIIFSLCTSSQDKPPNWNLEEARDYVRLDLYFESLCYRMQSLTTYSPPERPHMDCWATTKTVLDMMRGIYLLKIKTTTSSASLSHSRKMMAKHHGNSHIHPPTDLQHSTALSGMSWMHGFPASATVGQVPVDSSLALPDFDFPDFSGLPMDFDFDSFLDAGLFP